jgi:hypothetical protein
MESLGATVVEVRACELSLGTWRAWGPPWWRCVRVSSAWAHGEPGGHRGGGACVRAQLGWNGQKLPHVCVQGNAPEMLKQPTIVSSE